MGSVMQAAEFIQVATTADLNDGALMEAKAGDRRVLLARVGNKYYAAESNCPHMGARLADGKLEGTVLTCPRHASKFDLVDGHIIRWTDWTGVKASVSKLFRSPRALTVYPVKVEGNNILVKF